MKYYKIETIFSNDNNRIVSNASGDNVSNGEQYYTLLKDGKFHKEIPILKYFNLESYDNKKYWEYQLYDIHKLFGKINNIIGLYISDNFKILIERFNIFPAFHFYNTLLLYKEIEIKYWIFQYGIDSFKNYNLSKSVFCIENQKCIIKTQDDFWNKKREARKIYKSTLKLKKLAITSDYDFIFNQVNADTVISENLKNAIEDNGITGFEFSELDYEVVVA